MHRKRLLGQHQREPVLGALRAVELRFLTKQRPHVEQLLGALESPLFDAAYVEKVVDQVGEPPGLRVDDAQIVPARLGVEVPRQEELRESEHTREGCPQLMRNRIHEVRLQALALAELRVLLLELGPGALEALRHLVEASRELAHFPRATLFEAHRQLAAREAASPFGRLANGPRDRSGQIEAEDEHQGCCDDKSQYSELDCMSGLRVG